jgi:four helix bundle protein
MKLEELQIYQLSMDIAGKIWKIACNWNYFEKNSIGIQLVKSADSIAANISEGFGRFHYSENRQFCYYSRGSLFETRTWLIKAYERQLLETKDYLQFMDALDKLGVKLNNYIKMIGKIKPDSASE